MELGDLKVRISADIAKLSQGLQQAQAKMASAGTKMQSIGSSMQSVGAKMSLGVTAPLLLMGKVGVEELASIEKANAQTAASIARIGSKSLVSVAGVQALAGALQKKSGIDDQVIQSGANMLLTLGSIDTKTAQGKKTFETATRSMVDFAEATGTDAAAAGKLYAKSMAAANAGTILLPKGVKLSAAEMKKLTAEFNAAKGPGERQAVVAEALGKKFEGAAKLTSTEKWAVLQDQLAGVAASVVEQLMPAATQLIEKLGAWSDKFASLDPGTKKVIAVTVALVAVMGPLVAIIGTVVTVGGAIIAMFTAWSVAATAAEVSMLGFIAPFALIVAAVVAVVAVGVLLYKNWDTIKEKAVEAWTAIKSAVSTALDAVKSAVTNAWDAIKTATTNAWNAVKGAIDGVMTGISSGVNTVLVTIKTWFVNTWNHIATKTTEVWNNIKDTALNAITSIGPGLAGAAAALPKFLNSALVDLVREAVKVGSSLAAKVTNAVTGIGGDLASAAAALPSALWAACKDLISKAGSVGSAIGDAIKAGINSVISKWNDLTIPGISVKGHSITPDINTPNLPMFARGGIATSPAIFGDGPGSEAAVPLGDSAQERSDRARVMRDAGLAGSGGGQTFIFNGADVNMFAVAQRAAFQMMSAGLT